MVIYKILKYPDIMLRKKSIPVEKINNKIQKIIYKMFNTMYINKGIGLAAPQINIHLNIIVIDITKKNNQPIVLINPKKIYTYDSIKSEEGCLSLTGITKKIHRSKTIKIQALNFYGQKIYLETNSLLSICIQHEMDHLIGKLIIDY